jgi:hypothetical protein
MNETAIESGLGMDSDVWTSELSTPSVLRYKAFKGSKFFPKYKASKEFLVST